MMVDRQEGALSNTLNLEKCESPSSSYDKKMRQLSSLVMLGKTMKQQSDFASI